MSTSLSTDPYSHLLTYQRPVHVLIDYKEAYELLKELEHRLHPDLQGNAKELLGLMVQQYFSRYSPMLQEPEASTQQRWRSWSQELLEPSRWEQTDEAMAVTLLIIRITQTFLPGFSAHRSEDCAGILNVSMHTPTVALLEIDPVVAQRFLHP